MSFSDLFAQRSSTDSSETAKVVHELHNAVARESQDRANREFNLIVSGVPEVSGTEANRQTDAEQQVKKILQTILTVTLTMISLPVLSIKGTPAQMVLI